jgi:SOS regulatory protein LexA
MVGQLFNHSRSFNKHGCRPSGGRQKIARPFTVYNPSHCIKRQSDQYAKADATPSRDSGLYQTLPRRQRLPANPCGNRSGTGFQVAQRGRRTPQGPGPQRRHRDDAWRRGIRIPGFEAKADDSTLPIIGRAAGAPILAQQHIEESCNINPAFFHPRADYLLRVHGMSMKDIGIFDGDLLAVHTTREARNGQVVVARIGDEVTVKRFKREGSKVWLIAENPEFAPIEVDLKDQELVIEGLSVGVIRR